MLKKGKLFCSVHVNFFTKKIIYHHVFLSLNKYLEIKLNLEYCFFTLYQNYIVALFLKFERTLTEL